MSTSTKPTPLDYVLLFVLMSAHVLAIVIVIMVADLIAPTSTTEPATAQIVCEAAPPLLPSFEACFTK